MRRRLRAEEEAEEERLDRIKARKAETVSMRRKLSDPTTDTLWAAELSTWVNSNVKYQKGCMPTAISAAAPFTSKPKGLVILFHTFSSCPSDMLTWAKGIADRGFEVLLPLLPGHGHAPIKSTTGKLFDDHFEMPRHTGTGVQTYQAFAERINNIAAAWSQGGVIAVAGMGMGASIAQLAMASSPKLYSRGVLVSPFYELADTAEAASFLELSEIGNNGMNISWHNASTGWDDASSHPLHDCETERSQGRPGYCQFLADHVSAAIDVGKAAEIAADKHEVPVQVVAAAVDPFGNADSRKKTTSKMMSATACDVKAGADPSLVSDYSSPWLKNWWSASVISQTAGFLDTGKRIKSGSDGICDMTVTSASANTNNPESASMNTVIIGSAGALCALVAIIVFAISFGRGGNSSRSSGHEQL